MNVKTGKNPEGIKGAVTFTGGLTKPAIRDAGVVYVQSVNPNVWLPTDAEAARLFVAA